MSLASDQFINHLEDEWNERPTVYKARLILLAIFGYLYIAFVVIASFFLLALLLPILLFIAAVLGGWLFIMVILIKGPKPVFGFFAAIFRSFRVRFDSPTGEPLCRSEAPRLYAYLDQLRKDLNAPRIHQILINTEQNASVYQIPRLGFFGWYKNYIVIGLPYLLAMSPEQINAILAHEIAHIAHYDGRMGAWVYRVSQIWDRLAETFQQPDRRGGFFFKRFIGWYSPLFSAYSFAWTRVREYEADRLAGNYAGKEPAASALITIAILDLHLKEAFWSKLDDRAEYEPVPIDLIKEMMLVLADPPDSEKTWTWLQMLLQQTAGYTDTHPSLSERLTALGAQPKLPTYPTVSAAEVYLGVDLTRSLGNRITKKWQEAIAESWADQYQRAEEGRQRLKELIPKASVDTLTANERVEYALLIEHHEGLERAIPLFVKAFSINSEHVSTQFHYGRILLLRGDARGVDLIQKAYESDWAFLISGANLVCSYLNAEGKSEEATVIGAKTMEKWDKIMRGRAERQQLFTNDFFLRHGLSSDLITATLEKLKQLRELRNVYLVRKKVKHFPEFPVYLLLYQVKNPLMTNQKQQEITQSILEAIGEFPGDLWVVPLTWSNRDLKKVKHLPGSRIYSA